jgi:hypothetical protein
MHIQCLFSRRFQARRSDLLHRANTYRSRTLTAQAVQHVSAFWHGSTPPVPEGYKFSHNMAQRFQKARRSPNGETSVSRVYRDANTKEPSEYWEYENLAISWGYENCFLDEGITSGCH